MKDCSGCALFDLCKYKENIDKLIVKNRMMLQTGTKELEIPDIITDMRVEFDCNKYIDKEWLSNNY